MTDDNPIRVLVAEDDDAVRGALSALIGEEPKLLLVAAVGDAEAAIEAAQRERPNVALLDVRMPGGGGTRAARGIKRVSPETHMLALSAYEDRATVLEMVEAGVDGYLVKGSTIGTIVGSIEQAAEGRGSLSTEVTTGVIEELAEQLGVQRRAEERCRRSEQRIRSCLDQPGAFQLVFQPICTLDGSLVGTEALSRFRGPPKRGPERWFAEASEVGLRAELELAAVRTAFEDLPSLPTDAYLSVNLSPATVMGPAFHKLIGIIDASRIVVEVTEHAPIDDYGRMNDAVRRIRALGARLAIDDAGAGFASLRHILRLDPDFIKLDRTLIRGIGGDQSKQALAAGLISFAEKIGATIVAEGIETPAELRALDALGVLYGQGFYLARPVPLEKLGTLRPRRTKSAA
jgi:EAL domain-containing protein (putative c-di-GMP-specific phosphodiesterase class I)/AmiR/NasT family two-component response regulator